MTPLFMVKDQLDYIILYIKKGLFKMAGEKREST
jgi:hypothetical protein